MNLLTAEYSEKTRKLYILIFILLIAFKLFLVRYQPLLAITYAAHDDRHFIDQARSILGGDWLGTYSQLTLIKGPFLPLWIAFTFLLGVPFLLSLHLLYIFSCLILIIALRPLLRRPAYSLFLFAVLLFNPLTYDTYAATRVTRDALYAGLCLLAIACAIALFLRRNESLTQKLPWALGLGFAFSALSLTREETVWLVPSLLFIFVLTWIGLGKSTFKNRLRDISIWGLLPLIYVLSIGIISLLNYKYYSVFNVTEMKAPEFVAAYSAAQRVVPEQFMPMVPVSKETRLRIYQASPAFRELEAFFESPQNPWDKITVKGMDSPKGEILGGWFIWAFRDAVAAAGHYSNGKFPAEYYQTLAGEVNRACETGQLKCISKPATLAPVWNNAYLEPAADAFWEGLKLVVTFGNITSQPGESNADGKGELLFRDLTQDEISKSPEIVHEISGWAVNADLDVYVAVTKINGELGTNTKVINGLPSPDVFDYFLSQGKTIPAAKSSRFTVTTPCKACMLEIRSGSETLGKLKLDGLSAPTAWNDAGTFVFIDSEQTFSNGLVYQSKYNGMKVVILDWIGHIFQRVFPILTVIAVILFIVLTIRIKKSFDAWAVASTLGLTTLSRMLLLSIISASSFPSMFTLYLAPAYPMLISFAIFVLISLFGIIAQHFFNLLKQNKSFG